MAKVLNKIRSLADDMKAEIATLLSSQYTTERDSDANLILHFKDGDKLKCPPIPFRPYQIEAAKKLFIEGIKRLLLERPRRSGKEVESFNFIIQGALESPGLYMMVYPTNVRARAVLWDGSILLPSNESLKFLDMIPKRLISHINNAEMKVKLSNGSIIWIVGSDIDPDKLRGTNARGIVFAEFAFQDPRVCYVMLPVLRQNGGWMLAQSTFDGMNHFYQMIESNKNDPLWYCRVDSITNLVDEDGNRYITDEMIEEDRRAGMPEYLIQQEYYGIVEVNQETKYFAHALNHLYHNNQITEIEATPNDNLYTFWDLGVNDKTAILLVQFKRKYEVFHPMILGYIENNNREFKYYIDLIRQFAAKRALVVHSHFAPHDGAERDFYNGLKDIRAHGQALGEYFQVVKRPPTLQYGIEVMRQVLHLSYIDKRECQRLLDCFANYGKEYNDKLGVYKDRPLHDWSSHGVKAFQTLALALTDHQINDHAYETVYIKP